MKFAFKTLPGEKGTPIHEVWLDGKMLTQVTDVCFVCQAGHAPKVRLEFVPTEIDVDADVVAISDPPQAPGVRFSSHVNANGDVWAGHPLPSNTVFTVAQLDAAVGQLDTAVSSRGPYRSWISNVPLPGADYGLSPEQIDQFMQAHALPGKPFTLVSTPKSSPNPFEKIWAASSGEALPPEHPGKWNFVHIMPPLFQAAPTTPHTRDELFDTITACTRHLASKEPTELFTTKDQRIRLANVLFGSHLREEMQAEDRQSVLRGESPSSGYHTFVQGPVGTLLGVPLRDAPFFAVCGKLFSGDRVWVTTADNLDALKAYIVDELKGLLRVEAS